MTARHRYADTAGGSSIELAVSLLMSAQGFFCRTVFVCDEPIASVRDHASRYLNFVSR